MSEAVYAELFAYLNRWSVRLVLLPFQRNSTEMWRYLLQLWPATLFSDASLCPPEPFRLRVPNFLAAFFCFVVVVVVGKGGRLEFDGDCQCGNHCVIGSSNGGCFARLRRLQSELVGTHGCPRASKFVRRLFVQFWRWLVVVGLGGRNRRPSPSSSTSSCESKWRAHTRSA